MRVNYHTHTARCNHATGTEQQYVECALQGGLEVLGFADHSPYLFAGDHYSWFRMKPEELPEYVNTVSDLRQAYGDRIQIPIGVEVEYYPSFFHKLLPFLQDNGIEYMLLGQHYVYDEVGYPYCANPTADTDIFKAYCRQAKAAMQTGLFTYFAHPDLINFTGSRQLYREEMTALCREAKSCGIPLEYNLLGLRGNRSYPCDRFWELAAQEGCTVVLGVDAHDPQSLNDPVTEAKARKTLQQLGLSVLEYPPLQKI